MGLNIHVRIGDKQSKSEAKCFPTRENTQNWIKYYNKASLPSIIDHDAPKIKIFR